MAVYDRGSPQLLSESDGSNDYNLESDNEEGDLKQKVESRLRPFPPATVAVLRAYYGRGMRGVGERYKLSIAGAAAETSLTHDQVKVHCIVFFFSR